MRKRLALLCAAATLVLLPACLGNAKRLEAEPVGMDAALDFSSLQNCGPVGYRKMLQLLIRPRCYSCHGTGQQPPIAVKDFATALDAAKANASKLLTQVSTPHGGCTVCNLTSDDPLYQDLAQWVMQDGCDAAAAGGGSSGGSTARGPASAGGPAKGTPSPLVTGDFSVDLSGLSSGYVGAEIRFHVTKLGQGWAMSQVSTTAPPVNLILTRPRFRIGADERELVEGELTIGTDNVSDPDINSSALVWLSGSEPLVFAVDNIRSVAESEGDGPRAVYAEASNRKHTQAESLAYFNDTVKPALQAAVCANCHGAGDPVMTHSSAFGLLATGSAANNNRFFNKPREANGVTHSGGRRCASDTTAPCQQIMDWWNYEF